MCGSEGARRQESEGASVPVGLCVSGHGVRLGVGASVPARAGIQRNNQVSSSPTPPPGPGPALGGAVPITSATATT